MQMKNNTPAAQEKCIVRLLLYHFGVNLPVMLASYPVFRHMGMQSSLPFPSWYFQVLYILKLFLARQSCEEIYSYPFIYFWNRVHVTGSFAYYFPLLLEHS